MPGSQDFAADPRNDAVLLYLNGQLVPRQEAKVSVFDAGFVLGDGVWEGLRLHHGAFLFLDAHMDRLYEGARAIALDIGVELHRFGGLDELGGGEAGVALPVDAVEEGLVESGVGAGWSACGMDIG